MSTTTNYNDNTRSVHDLLARHPDGLTVPDMAEILQIRATNINAVVRRSERIYVDRWEAREYLRDDETSTAAWVAVYCLAVAPADAPKPEMRPSLYLKAMRAAEAVGAR